MAVKSWQKNLRTLVLKEILHAGLKPFEISHWLFSALKGGVNRHIF